MNQLTRDFVKKFNVLETTYANYRQLAVKEMFCLEQIAMAKDDKLEEN
jgi:hypothetical protein